MKQARRRQTQVGKHFKRRISDVSIDSDDNENIFLKSILKYSALPMYKSNSNVVNLIYSRKIFFCIPNTRTASKMTMWNVKPRHKYFILQNSLIRRNSHIRVLWLPTMPLNHNYNLNHHRVSNDSQVFIYSWENVELTFNCR